MYLVILEIWFCYIFVVFAQLVQEKEAKCCPKTQWIWYVPEQMEITCVVNVRAHCNPLQGKYRFFTGNSLCSISTLTCFGSVQGLKGTNFIEIQGNICILYRNIALDIYIHVYVLITGISLLFEKQQHRILEKQGKPCK